MKLKYILFIAILNFYKIGFTFSQLPCGSNYSIDFEDSICLNHLYIDTVNFPQNIWQIGFPHKQTVDSSYSFGKIIATDTTNPYPTSNYSVYTISNIVDFGDIYGFKSFQGRYYVHSDTLNDFGKIEFSSDNGTTWIDLINDTTYSSSIMWYSPKPVLSGRSNTWKHFDVVLADNGSVFNLQLGDTVMYKFSFTSDSTFDNMDGLMFDNISFYSFVEGISEIRFKPVKSKIYPNPSADNFTIEFDYINDESYELAIYSIKSKLLYTQGSIKENKIAIDGHQLKPGIYVYKLTNLKDKKRCWGKFIKI